MKGKKSIDDSSAPVKPNLRSLFRPAPFLIYLMQLFFRRREEIHARLAADV